MHEWQAACLDAWRESGKRIYTGVWIKPKGGILLPLKAPLLGTFTMIRMMCPCKCWFQCFPSTYQKCSLLFPFIRPWPWLTWLFRCFHRAKWKCIITIPQPRLQENTKQRGCWQIHRAIWAYKLKISSSCSSSALSHELFVGSSPPCLSSWCGETHQESISRPCPCVSQSKSGASSSSPGLLAELFTTHWCGGWPAVLLVNYSCRRSSYSPKD